MDELEFAAVQRRHWAAGDYRPVGELLAPAAEVLVERSRAGPADRVLDVGVGTGNVAVAAARAGARVTGVDISEAWFEEARRRAADADVDLDLRVGDAQSLPLPDDSFDAVLSSFGAVMAPDHAAVAHELVRVCRPGGTLALTAWPSTSLPTGLLAAFGEHLPPPPDFAQPHVLWGDPGHVRSLFADEPVVVRFETSTLHVAYATLEDFERATLGNGPLVAARRTLEGLGRWDEVSARYRSAVLDHNEADDGTMRMRWDYLIILGAVAG